MGGLARTRCGRGWSKQAVPCQVRPHQKVRAGHPSSQAGEFIGRPRWQDDPKEVMAAPGAQRGPSICWCRSSAFGLADGRRCHGACGSTGALCRRGSPYSPSASSKRVRRSPAWASQCSSASPKSVQPAAWKQRSWFTGEGQSANRAPPGEARGTGDQWTVKGDIGDGAERPYAARRARQKTPQTSATRRTPRRHRPGPRVAFQRVRLRERPVRLSTVGRESA